MKAWRRTVDWLKANPLVADGLLATASGTVVVAWVTSNPVAPDGTVYREPGALAVALLVLATVPIAWRSREPLIVFVTTTFAVVSYDAAGFVHVPGAFGAVFAVYTVGAHGDRRRTLYGAGLAGAGALVLATCITGWDVEVGSTVDNVIVFATAWLIGDKVRTRRVAFESLQERAERAEQRQAEEARRAVAEERTRIARELHDVVAHSMSVMIVQAGAARRTLHKDPTRAGTALEAVEATGREAMTEMRRLLGVLRDGDGQPTPLTPQPSLSGLQELIDQCRRAGLTTLVSITGDERDLPHGVALTTYRIIQEALTNTLKHAGPATASVHVHYGEDHVAVEVRDDGRGASTIASGAGHGLIGMRERVEMYDGDLSAGPSAGGGYTVRARLPLTSVVR